MQERILTLKPNALPSSGSRRYDGRVVNCHVDLFSNDPGEVEGQRLIQRLVVDESVGWIGELAMFNFGRCNCGENYLHLRM